MSGNAGSAALAGNPGGGGAPAGGEGGQGGQQEPQGGAPAGGEKPWFETAGIDAKYAPAIAAKGWTNPNDILESYTNVEKLVSLERGGDVDRILVRPKADATPEEIAAFRAKAGFAAPEDVKDYGFTDEQIAQAPILADAAKWFKEAGLPKDVAGALMSQVQAYETAQVEAFARFSQGEEAAMSQEMGDKWADYKETAARFARHLQLTEHEVDGIERSIGFRRLMEIMHTGGSPMTEAAAPQPGKQGGSSQFTQTADQAKQRIDTLSRDSDFQAKLLSPNPEVRKAANAEWEGLFKTAYPS